MLLDNPRLTFGEIATRWAKENAEEPGALSRNEILRRLESALKNGEFSVANLTIKQPSSAKRDVLVGIRPVGDGAYSPLYERRDSKSVPVTEEMLSHPVYWQSDGYAKVSCFEDTEVPRGDFIDWCIKHGQPQPQFWSHDRSQKPSDEENSPRLQFDTQHTPSAVPLEPAIPSQTGTPRKKENRRRHNRDVEANALLENRIKAVIAKAKAKWPDPGSRPGANEMAQLLIADQPKSKVEDFGQEAIRKILAGIYKPAKVRSIPGLGSR